MVGKTTYVSVQSIGKAMGAKVAYDKKKNKVTITKESLKVTFSTNKKPILMKNDKPMMEIRLLAEKLGLRSYSVPEKNAMILYLE